MGRDTDVLVVGAGPTGLALGIDLARRGVPALVVERAQALFPGSRGKGIQPRTMGLRRPGRAGRDPGGGRHLPGGDDLAGRQAGG